MAYFDDVAFSTSTIHHFQLGRSSRKRYFNLKSIHSFYNKLGVNINQLYACNISILLCYFWGYPCIHMLISYTCLRKEKHLWFLPPYLWISYLASVRIMQILFIFPRYHLLRKRDRCVQTSIPMGAYQHSLHVHTSMLARDRPRRWSYEYNVKYFSSELL